MEKIKIKRRISSSTLRINELKKFLNKNVEIVITPLNEINEEAFLSEKALSKDWNKDKEDTAWAHLQKVR
ncbi:MAG: hypothetical protein KDC88_15690 [Ignavibacteriae bacterium]|nr:hypothetical protein [Ignavibacteriota bacterium]